MKSYRINFLLIVLLHIITFKLYAIDEPIDLNNPQGFFAVYGVEYQDNMSKAWNIDIGEYKPILFDISYDLEYGCDYIFIYSVSNNVETLIATLTGSGYDTISTIVPTGKAKVVFYSDTDISYSSPQGYTGFEAYYWIDNAYNSSTTQNSLVDGDLTVNGKSYLIGKVGIGTLDPEASLDVNGTFRLNRPSSLLDNYNTIGGDFILAPNPYSLSNNGYLKIGYPANNIIRFGTDYDGNVGTGIWKDIQFGRYIQPYLTIKDGGNIGIGTPNPNKIMQISKTDNTVNLSINNQSAVELWNPSGTLNTGAQINFRSHNTISSSGIGAVIGYLNKSSSSVGSNGNIVFGVKPTPTTSIINPAMVIQYNGNVGIGVDTPQVKLHINNDGALLAQGTYNNGWDETNLGAGTRMLWYPKKAAFRVGHVNGTQWDNNNIGNYSFANGFNTISSGTSSVAMGHDSKATNSYAIAMGMQANASNMSALALGYQTTASGKYSTSLGYLSRATGENSVALGKWVNATETNSMAIGLGASSQDRLVNNTPNSLIIGFNTTSPTLFVGSKVGIGTDQPDCELTVNGVIHAREIKIELSGPLADFVFSPNYSLMPLYEVETFVKTNQHLPEIPSAVHVKDNGLHLGEMQNKLLQKIEELTLYVIEQQKQIDALKARLDEK